MKPTERQKRSIERLKMLDVQINNQEVYLKRLLESRRELINREGLNKLEGFNDDK